MIIYRTAFDEIQSSTVLVWFALDYFADLIYLMDILIHFRTGGWWHWWRIPNLTETQLCILASKVNTVVPQIDYSAVSPQLCRFLENQIFHILISIFIIRILGGWSATDRNIETAAALYEHNHILHRSSVSTPARLPLSLTGFPVHAQGVQACQNLQILGVSGPDRAPHQLSQSVPAVQFNALPVGGLPLECLHILCHSQRNRFWLCK